MSDKVFSCGAIASPADPRNYRLVATAVAGYPDEYMRENIPTPIQQGSIGNCVAQALCYCGEAANGLKFNPNWVYGRRPEPSYMGWGWYISEGLRTLNREGNVPLQEDDEEPMEVLAVIDYVERNLKNLQERAEPFKVEAYARLSSADEIKFALMNGMYVVCAVNVTSYYPDANHHWVCYNQLHGAHAISIWGWKGNDFRILNSWGKGWGDRGQAWVSTEDILRLRDVWAITDIPTEFIVNPEDENEMRVKIRSTVPVGKKLAIREERSSKSALMGYMKADDVGVMIGEYGDWAEVCIAQTEAKTVSGWVSKKYITDEVGEDDSEDSHIKPEPNEDQLGPEPEDESAKLQWYLHKWGFGPIVGEIDGIVGSNTRKAVRQFQAAMSLEADGIVGKKTWAALKQDIIIPVLTEKDMMCQCEGKYCDGYPNDCTIAVRIFIERVRREHEKVRPGIVYRVSNIAHPAGDGAIAGGQRCKQWNSVRGGASNSQHLYGLAADIFPELNGESSSVLRKELEDLCMKMNVSGGVGYGAKYIVHVDMRGQKARWEY